MTTVDGLKKLVTILVQGDKPNEWFPASDNQIALLIKSGLTESSLSNEGRFTIVDGKFATATGMAQFKYTLYPSTDRYCRLFYLKNNDTRKTRMIYVTELPQNNGAEEMTSNNIKKKTQKRSMVK